MEKETDFIRLPWAQNIVSNVPVLELDQHLTIVLRFAEQACARCKKDTGYSTTGYG